MRFSGNAGLRPQKAIMVAAGGDRFDGAMDIAGWRFECKLSGRDTSGDYCVYDTVRSVKGGPPLHIHRDQDDVTSVTRVSERIGRTSHPQFVNLDPISALVHCRVAELEEVGGALYVVLVEMRPAAAVTEEGSGGCARVIRQEARHRLREGKGIKVFSRPERLHDLLASWGLTVEDRKSCIVDAGKYVPTFSKTGPEKAEFFVHSPFAWRVNDREVEDRNQRLHRHAGDICRGRH